jgi:hypothetical protein
MKVQLFHTALKLSDDIAAIAGALKYIVAFPSKRDVALAQPADLGDARAGVAEGKKQGIVAPPAPVGPAPNLNEGTFETGQWLKGRVISGDVTCRRKMTCILYFTATYHEPYYSLSAVSRPPCFATLNVAFS